MASESYHEPYDVLPAPTRELHRAVTSLIEELEAIDWYQQRADVCADEELRAILLHNKGEEIEHAMMILEWLRRRRPDIDKNVRTYLLTKVPITEIEAEKEAGGGAGEGGAGAGAAASGPTLGIGSLKEG